MSVEIHAALIGGGLILIGILVEQWFARRGQVRRALEEAVHRAGLQIGGAFLHIQSFGQPGSSDHWPEYEVVFDSLIGVEIGTRRRRWIIRRRRRVRRATSLILASLYAAQLRAAAGNPFTAAEQKVVTDRMAELQRLMFGRTKALNDVGRWFIERGVDTEPPPVDTWIERMAASIRQRRARPRRTRRSDG